MSAPIVPIVHKAPPEGGIRVINAAQPWGLRNLFSGTVQGAWCDPEAGTTLFQDAAATTPVTAVEQQLGARLDRSGWGNHATQATAGKRPAYSRRVNALVNTENPSAWQKTGITGTDEAGGVLLLQSTADNSSTTVGPYYPIGATPITNTCIYRSIEYLPGDALYVAYGPAAGGSFVTVRTSDGAVVGAAGGAVPLRKITTLADGWVRIETWDSLASHGASQLSNLLYFGNTFGGLYIATTGRAGTQLRVRKPQYVVLPFGSTHSVDYQRVNTASDYDAAPEKFPAYLTTNGTSHMLQSATGAGGTTGFYYCAPIRLLKLGAVQVLWSDATGNTGYEVRINASNQLELSAGTGAARVSVASAALVLGRTYILTAMHDGAALSVQVDSGAPVSAACGPIAAGTAGYTLFRAAGTDTGYANVREYGFIYTKNHCPSATHRAMAAQILAAKARITL